MRGFVRSGSDGGRGEGGILSREGFVRLRIPAAYRWWLEVVFVRHRR